MDQLSRQWYGLTLEVELRRRTEQAYEDLFCDLMFAKHSDNFQSVKAAGRDGDGKADGYLFPEKCVFQSYAPSSGFNKAKLLAKIADDFTGARISWGEQMAKWTFVHNGFEGLPKYGLLMLQELDSANESVEVTPAWGPQKVKELALGLPKSKLVTLFGPAPTEEDLNGLTHAPIRTLLRALSKRPVNTAVPIEPVSKKKLRFNRLSEDAEGLLAAGRRKEKLVDELLSSWPDPDYGDELAEAFNTKYLELRDDGASQDEIFAALKTFACGDTGDVATQVSALAVLSYFFERCDIFENAPEGWADDTTDEASEN